MTQEDKQWVECTKAWLKTQRNNIASCALNIKHAKEQISLLQKSIELETAECTEKENLLRDVEKNLKAKQHGI